MKLKTQGIPKIKNQIRQIDSSVSIIKTYTKTLARTIQAHKKYDEKKLSTLLANFFSKELGIFQLRLLSSEGMELIRYDLTKDNRVVKAHILQDKSSRYYYQEAKTLDTGKLYLSKLDLNKENGKIEKPYKKTIRLLEKVQLAGKNFFIVINYDLTTMLQTQLHTTLFNLFFIEKDGQINMHLNDKFAFSKQQHKALYWDDFIQTKEEYITKRALKSLPYDVIISIKKSQLSTLQEQKALLIKKMVFIALFISIVISLFIYYFLEKYLRNLSTDVLHILKTGKRKHHNHFKEFTHILNKVEKQQNIIHHTILDLKRQKEFTNSILDSQSNFVLITDGLQLKKTNKTLLNFFNYPSLEAFHKEYECICDFFVKREGYLAKEQEGKSWLEVVLADINKEHQVIIKDRQGKKHIFHIFTRKFTNEEGNYVITLSDITELTILRQALEEKVAMQLASLRAKDEQLLQQSRLAQMGEMLSMIAHQWRQPLSAISATTGNLSFKLMMDDIEKKEFEEEIALINNYAQHLSKTIDDFRGFFKGNKEKVLTSLDEIVQRTLNIAGISAKSQNIDIQAEFSCSKEIYTFDSELQQVIINIIKNAEDALIENKIEDPTIVIDTQYADNIHTLTIKDNANGIPADIIDTVFDPYFSTKLEKDGTGLGLYMSKTIVEEHCNGTINVKNNEFGAVFTIQLKGNE